MLYRFAYEGNTPSKKNQKKIGIHPKTKRIMIFPSTEFERWHKPAVLQMKLQMSRMVQAHWPIPRCKHVIAKIFYTDKRRRDTSNTFESIMDLLVDAGVLTDDNWSVVGPTLIYPFLRPERPGWEIALVTDEPEQPRTLEGGRVAANA